MLKEDLERAIIHANLCLKDWKKNKSHLLDIDGTRSLIIGWIVRVINRSTSWQDWRSRKAYSRGVAKSLFFTVDEARACFTSLRIGDNQMVKLPDLDYDELNKRSEDMFFKSSLPESVLSVNFKSIEQIKFN